MKSAQAYSNQMENLQRRWKEEGLKENPELRKELIREYAPLVKIIAERISNRLPPSVELDDLINAGVLGLIDALNKFDSSRGVQFTTYAKYRIKGAILDQLRALDWVPRGLRQKARKLEETSLNLQKKLGREPTEEELAESLNLSIQELHELTFEIRGVLSFRFENLDMVSSPYGDKNHPADFFAPGRAEDPFSLLSLKEAKEAIAQYVGTLPERDRLIISLYYYDQLTMKEIGRVIGLTEVRVCQIHAKIIHSLRQHLKKLNIIE